jgi:hypothetical protein
MACCKIVTVCCKSSSVVRRCSACEQHHWDAEESPFSPWIGRAAKPELAEKFNKNK